MRFAKILRFGSTRADIGVDLYNLFNTNDTTTFDANFALRDQRRDLAAADGHRAAALRAIQRDVQFLARLASRSHVAGLLMDPAD